MCAEPRDGLWVHPSWLAHAMSGYASCLWAPWFRTRFRDWSRPAEDVDWTLYRIAHTRFLNQIRAERRAVGDIVVQEAQGAFRLRRPSGLTISGQPDLIAIGDGRATVFEAKTGRPNPTHRIQVLIYMHCLARTNPALKQVPISGEIRYENGAPSVHIEPGAAVGEFADHFDYFMTLLEADDPPDQVPSATECRFCNIGRPDCTARIDGAADDFDPQDNPF